MKQAMKDLQAGSEALARYCPEVNDGFSRLRSAALKQGKLDTKTKELICLGMALVTHCVYCIGGHTWSCYKAGATTEELMEVASLAVYMGGGPAKAYVAELKKAIDLFENQQP